MNYLKYIFITVVIILLALGCATTKNNDSLSTANNEESTAEIPEFFEDNNDSISLFPDKEASFPGGVDAMVKYISKNVKYPNKAIKNNDQGKVFVQFVVEKNGKISNIEVLRGVSKELDKEAMRVVRKMPKWFPAELDGKPVRSRMRIPFNFEF